MALVRAEFHGEGLSLMNGYVEIGRVVKMKNRGGGGDPLDGMNFGVMIEFYVDLQGADIFEGKAEVHRVENGLADGMFVGEKGRKGTAMDGKAVGSETGLQNLISGSELH
jgi:hypothetical protein